MDYTETETSKMLKKCNDILYETIHKISKTKSANVRNSLQKTLRFMSKSISEYAAKREEEIVGERSQVIILPSGNFTTKGTFIDIQRAYELDDEETANYIMMIDMMIETTKR
jgi:hypothetical protein